MEQEIRRSSRTTERNARQHQTELAASSCLNKLDPAGFQLKYINEEIGRGVFTTKTCNEGDFLLQYPGQRISWKEASDRDKKYEKDGEGSFLYYFKLKEKYYCVDATLLDGRLNMGKMVNDAPVTDPACNSVMRIVGFEGQPHLCIFAKRKIKQGEEIRYDYGVESLPWRKKRQSTRKRKHVENEKDEPDTSHIVNNNVVNSVKKRSTMNKKQERCGETIGSHQNSEVSNTHAVKSKDYQSCDSENTVDQESDEDITECDAGESSRSEFNASDHSNDSDNSECDAGESSRREFNASDHFDDSDNSECDAGESSRREFNASDHSDDSDNSECDAGESSGSEFNASDHSGDSDDSSSSSNTSVRLVKEAEDLPSESVEDESSRREFNAFDHSDDSDNSECDAGESSRREFNAFDHSDDSDNSECDAGESSGSEFNAFDHSGDSDDSSSSSNTSVRLVKEAEALPSELDVPVESSENKSTNSDYSHYSDVTPSSSKSKARQSSSLPEYRILGNEQKVFCSKHPGIFIKKFDNQSKKSKTGRSYDIVHACYFCGKLMTNIQKHIVKKHRNEAIVKKILKMKKDTELLTDRKAKKLIDKSILNEQCLIRNEGDNKHNLLVMKHRKGELLVSRRRKGDLNSESYGACPECLEWIVLRENYNQHRHTCPANSKVTMTEAVMQNLIFQGRIISTASPQMKAEVFPIMHTDAITTTAITDRLIVALGEIHFMSSISNRLKRKNYSSYRMRLAGRLLHLVREEIGSLEATMSECLKVENFDTFAKCAILACGKNVDSEMQHPSVALKIGFDLAKITAAKIGFAAKNRADDEYKEAKMFQTVLKAEWKLKVRKQAAVLLDERRFNKSNELPDPDDVAKLAKYLVDKLNEVEWQEVVSTSEVYRRLAVLTEARLLLYNRRRPGELEALTIETYRKRSTGVSETDLSLRSELSQLEKKLLDTQELLELRGKGNKRVPVILPAEVKQPLKILANARIRQACGVNPLNKYLFATTGLEPLRAGTSLDIVKHDAGLKFPLRILATNLRKHTATISQVMGLKDNELRWLVNHMGHTERVHLQHYRATSGMIERLDVAKIMLMQEQNCVARYAGVELKDINFEDIEDSTNAHTSTAAEVSTHSEAESELEDDIDDTDLQHATAKRKPRSGTRVPWEGEELKEVKKYFIEFINETSTNPCPRMNEILQACAKSKAAGGQLWRRNWETIKKKVSYLIGKAKRRQ